METLRTGTVLGKYLNYEGDNINTLSTTKCTERFPLFYFFIRLLSLGILLTGLVSYASSCNSKCLRLLKLKTNRYDQGSPLLAHQRLAHDRKEKPKKTKSKLREESIMLRRTRPAEWHLCRHEGWYTRIYTVISSPAITASFCDKSSTQIIGIDHRLHVFDADIDAKIAA